MYDRDPDCNTYAKIAREIDWPASKVHIFYMAARGKRKRADAMLENTEDLDPGTKVNDFIEGADLVNCFLWGAGYFA